MKKKKDILFLCQFFYPEYVSSATLPFDTASAYAKAGYSVGAICGYPKEYSCQKQIPKKEIYQGISIKRIKYLQLERKRPIGRCINYLSFLLAMLFNLFECRKYKYIFVYSNPPVLPLLAALAKKLYRNRIVFVSYDVYPEIGIQSQKIKKNGLVDKIFRISNKWIFKSIDNVVALSDDMKEMLCKERGLDPEQVFVIPNWGEDKQNCKKSDVQNSLFSDIPANAFVVSYLGNLGICQDERTMLEVMEQLKNNKNIHFLIAGHGVKMSKLREKALNKNLENVHIYDFLHGKDYEDALEVSDMCMATLINGMRGLCSPSKVSNYLMAGKPVMMVCEAGIGIAEDILAHNCGYRIQPGDTGAMRQAILDLTEDRHKKQMLGRNSRALFEEKYEKSVCLEKYIVLVERNKILKQ